MMRLVKAGLMYGNLYEVTSPAMVERYNRALEYLTGKRTALTEFHIDIVGASPEIAHELDDELYLNPNGANQMFILLSTEQTSSPLLNQQFSVSRDILKRYIEENEAQLFALTAREAVAGELHNSLLRIKRPSDLLDLRLVEVTADTTQSHVREADDLAERIERFQSEPDAWWDDVLIADMIELAKRTGNIQRNPVKLEPRTYEVGNYFTEQLGGVYVFRDAATPALISREPLEGGDDLKGFAVMTLDDRDAIANWLRDEGLTQLIVQRPNQQSALVIRQKMDFIVVGTAADKGHDLKGLTRQDMRMLERRYARDLPEAYDGLMAVWRWASMGGRVPKMGPNHPAFFYALRSSQHEHRDLVNMLLTELSPLDFRQLFICHKSLFYSRYRDWPDSKREFVVRFLEQEYAMDKAGAREALFGPEPAMREDEDSAGRRLVRRKDGQLVYRERDDDDEDDDDDDDDDRRKRRKSGRRKREDSRKKKTSRRGNPWEPRVNVNRQNWGQRNTRGWDL